MRHTRLALFVSMVVAVMLLVGCGRAAEGRLAKSLGGEDSSVEAWAVAEEAISARSKDAVLASVGTQGVVLSEAPSSWDFVFFSAADKHVWRVSVEHGKALAPEDMGEAGAVVDTKDAITFESIEVGGAQAVERAREFGEKSGEVPPNVMVNGSFLGASADKALGTQSGVWTVSFLKGTSKEGMRQFTVDMRTGAVSAVK